MMYVILFFGLWILFVGIVYKVDGWIISSDIVFVGGISFVLSVFVFFIHGAILSKNEFNSCLEQKVFLTPKVVYLSDSTEKIFKYSVENSFKEIHVKNTEPYFHVPESLIYIEPCSGKMILKDVQ